MIFSCRFVYNFWFGKIWKDDLGGLDYSYRFVVILYYINLCLKFFVFELLIKEM